MFPNPLLYKTIGRENAESTSLDFTDQGFYPCFKLLGGELLLESGETQRPKVRFRHVNKTPILIRSVFLDVATRRQRDTWRADSDAKKTRLTEDPLEPFFLMRVCG